MIDPTTSPDDATPARPSPDEPISDRYRSSAPSDPAEIRRKLLFGVALVLALASVYAGLLEWGRALQFGFAGLAVAAVLIALITAAAGPPGAPPPPPRA